MAQSIKNRVFGGDIPKQIKQKLEYRQALAKSAKPGESLTTINYKSNFEGDFDLYSLTPFARMWTAVAVL